MRRSAATLLLFVSMAMLVWSAANAVNMHIGSGRALLAGNAVAALPSGSAVVLSVRKAVSGYAGNAFNLRNSGGSTQDIGFVGSDLDAPAIATFCGATALCTIAKWYDQSGNGVDFVQATVANQPPLVKSQNGKYQLSCSGVASLPVFLRTGSALPSSLSSNFTAGGAISVTSSELGVFLANRDNLTPFNGWFMGVGLANPGNKFLTFFDTTKAATVSDTTNLFPKNPEFVAVQRNAGSRGYYVNGALSTTSTGGGNTAPTAVAALCAQFTAGAANSGFSGGVSEIYMYPNATVSVASIQANESQYFGQQNLVAYAGTGALSFGQLSTTVGQEMSQAANVNNFERTNSFTLSAAVRLFAAPTTASVIYTNVGNTANFPGYEFYIDSQCALHIRIINTVSTNWIDMRSSFRSGCDGTWHVWTYSYDGSSTAAGVKDYLDGVADASPSVIADTLSASIVSAGQQPQIGNQCLGGAPTPHCEFAVLGQLDNFRVYNVAKSPSFIATNATQPAAMPCDSDAVTCFDFESADISGTTVTDHAATPHNGTLTSAQQAWP